MTRPRSEAHDWLPPYVYFDRGRYVYRPRDKSMGRASKPVRLCDGSAGREQVLMAYRAMQKGLQFGPVTASAEDILSHAQPIARTAGVYFLILNNEIVYVGRSTNCMSRIVNHMHTRAKAFDRYHVIEAPVSELVDLERRYIEEFRPRYNVSFLKVF